MPYLLGFLQAILSLLYWHTVRKPIREELVVNLVWFEVTTN